MNNLLAKCRAEKGQLKDRKERGARHIEIDIGAVEPKDAHEIEALTENIKESGMDALVIHVPMKRRCILESLGNPIIKERLRLVSMLAQNMHAMHGQDTIVVIHQELSLEQLTDTGLTEGIESTFREMIDEFPNVKYALENQTIVTFDKGNILVRQNYFDESPKLAMHLRKKLQSDKIGTVLDTCHVISSMRVLALLSQYGHEGYKSMEMFFDVHKDNLFLLHLSSSVNFGFNEDHATGFNSDDEIKMLKEIFENAWRIGFDGPITLEVNEDNHNNAVAYSKMMNDIRFHVRDKTAEDK